MNTAFIGKFACYSCKNTLFQQAARLLLSPLHQAHLLAQMGMKLLPEARALPQPKVMTGRTPRGKMSRQVTPLTTGLGDIEDRIEQFPERMFARPAFPAGLGETIITSYGWLVRKNCIHATPAFLCAGNLMIQACPTGVSAVVTT